MVQGYRHPLPVMERLARKSFWDGDCHVWAGAGDSSGYGQLTIGSRIDGTRRLVATHRAAWVEYHGMAIPSHLVVDHICHVRRCWAREHLRLLTPAENCSTVTPALAEVRRANLVRARAVRWPGTPKADM